MEKVSEKVSEKVFTFGLPLPDGEIPIGCAWGARAIVEESSGYYTGHGKQRRFVVSPMRLDFLPDRQQWINTDDSASEARSRKVFSAWVNTRAIPRATPLLAAMPEKIVVSFAETVAGTTRIFRAKRVGSYAYVHAVRVAAYRVGDARFPAPFRQFTGVEWAAVSAALESFRFGRVSNPKAPPNVRVISTEHGHVGVREVGRVGHGAAYAAVGNGEALLMIPAGCWPEIPS